VRNWTHLGELGSVVDEKDLVREMKVKMMAIWALD